MKKSFIISLVVVIIFAILLSILFYIYNDKKEYILISTFNIKQFGDNTEEKQDYSKMIWDLLMSEKNQEEMKNYFENLYGIGNKKMKLEIKNTNFENNSYEVKYYCKDLNKDDCYMVYRHLISELPSLLETDYNLIISNLKYEFERLK